MAGIEDDEDMLGGDVPASDRTVSKTDNQTKMGRDQLRSIVERIERLEEEKSTIATDIKEVYSEAKSNGYDVKALRVIVRLRKKDINQRQEEEAILETYMAALGMLILGTNRDDD